MKLLPFAFVLVLLAILSAVPASANDELLARVDNAVKGADYECGVASGPADVEGEAVAQRGCCSWHGGVCGCSWGRIVCCDGQYSPSCTCNTDFPRLLGLNPGDKK